MTYVHVVRGSLRINDQQPAAVATRCASLAHESKLVH